MTIQAIMAEHEWIHRYIRPLVTVAGADRLRDDVALLHTGDRSHSGLIATTDTLVQGVHFLADDPLETVGQKLIRVNVSDILAKGAVPCETLLAITWPSALPEAAFAALMDGIGCDLARFGLDLVGGDFTSHDGPLVLTATMTGQCGADGPVRRGGGGVAGAPLLVSGTIGWGAVGLAAARAVQGDPAQAMRYRVPELIPMNIAKELPAFAQASMDVSDGLLRDALALAEANGCGVHIVLDSVPLAVPDTDLTGIFKQVTGGDDYQILLVARPGRRVPDRYFTQIGTLTDTPGLALIYQGKTIAAPIMTGFAHRAG